MWSNINFQSKRESSIPSKCNHYILLNSPRDAQRSYSPDSSTPVANKMPLPAKQHVSHPPGHDQWRQKHQGPKLGSNLTMKMQVINRLAAFLRQTAPLNSTNLFPAEIIRCQNPTSSCFPCKESNFSRNLGSPNTLPWERMRAALRKNLIIRRLKNILPWRKPAYLILPTPPPSL